MTLTAEERGERAIQAVARRIDVQVPPMAPLVFARAVLEAQKSVYSLPVKSGRVRVTGRRLEALRLLTQGHSNREIAALMGIQESTAKRHIEMLRRELGARDRAHAAAVGVALGLVSPVEVTSSLVTEPQRVYV